MFDDDSDFCGSSEEEEEIDEVFDLTFKLNDEEIERLHEAFTLMADPFNHKLNFYELASALNSQSKSNILMHVIIQRIKTTVFMRSMKDLTSNLITFE